MRLDTSPHHPDASGRPWIIALAFVFVAAAIAIGFSVQHSKPTTQPAFGRPDFGQEDGRPGFARDEGARADMQKMAKEQLGLSEEQVKKMDAVWSAGPPKSREDFGQRRQRMREILTPEQQKKMEELRPVMMRNMFEKRMEKYRANLPPAEFEALKAKRLQRMQQRMQHRGGTNPAGGPPTAPSAPPQAAR